MTNADSTPKPIATWAALTAAIGALPPVPPGYVRVFRGQNRAYPRVVPTALRAPRARDSVWSICATQVAMSMRDAGGLDPGDDIDRVTLWAHAIKQHYGPGTQFLDVTHSLAVAAWFALHQLGFTETRHIYGLPGGPDPGDVRVAHRIAWHRPWEIEPGVLYAFDVTPGIGSSDLRHGVMFDLSLAPGAFSSSERIRAQQACLLYADGDHDGGDLSRWIVPGTPLLIGWPLTGCPNLHARTGALFPPVEEDDWYSRFVSLPLAPSLVRSTDSTVFEHAVDVTLYDSGTPESPTEIRPTGGLYDRIVVSRPALLFDACRSIVAATSDAPGVWPKLPEATALLLEGPLFATSTAGSRLHRGLLSRPLPATAPCRDLVTGEVTPDVDLLNVFIELSSLDGIGVFRERLAGEDAPLRAIWIVRENDRLWLSMWSDNGLAKPVLGPIPIRIDQDRFWMDASPEPIELTAVGELGIIATPLFRALAFIRSLAPVWKLSASTRFHAGTGTDNSKAWAHIEWALGEILSLRGYAAPLSRYHVLRRWGHEDPYYGAVGPGDLSLKAALEITGPTAYADISVDRLDAAAEVALRALDGGLSPLPWLRRGEAPPV